MATLNESTKVKPNMSQLIKTLVVAAALILAQPVLARGSVQARSPATATFVIPPSGSISIDQVRDCVATAGGARGWRMVSDEPGNMTLYIKVRDKHEVTVRVAYDQKGIQVFYVSSTNLDHRLRGDVVYIHPKYNMWVDSLMQDILAKVAMTSRGVGN